MTADHRSPSQSLIPGRGVFAVAVSPAMVPITVVSRGMFIRRPHGLAKIQLGNEPWEKRA